MTGKTHNQYKKVRKEGGARVLALTPFIPKDWKLVRIIQQESDEAILDEHVILLVLRVV